MARNEKEESIRLGLWEALSLLFPYFRTKIIHQSKPVLWMVFYLVLFQLFFLRLPTHDFLSLGFGILAVIVGLSLFLEGLFLGLMPMGEALGIRLPQQSTLFWIFAVSFFLGIVATLAEPAIAVLKLCGSNLAIWDAPLLYFLLNEGSLFLFYAIAIGVGIAVVFGVLRFLYGISMQWILVPLVLVLLVLSIYCYFDPNLRAIIGLAWDSGAVTTGPVTVPLVVALGLGIAKMSGADQTRSGYGIVTLASLFPILAVFLVSLYFAPKLPHPMSKQQFDSYSLSNTQKELLYGKDNKTQESLEQIEKEKNIWKQFIESVYTALRSILPICLFLSILLILVYREKLAYPDELVLGILFCIFGLSLFHFGILYGLRPLGSQVGNKLPSTFRAIELEDRVKFIPNVDPKQLVQAMSDEGYSEPVLILKEKKNYTTIPFVKENWDPTTKSYRYIPIHGPLYGKEDSILGYLVVLLFAFFLGFTATMAEPALSALGKTVEESTVGTFRKEILIQAVGIGVGLGTLVGVTQILWEIPLFLILTPVYLVLLLLNFFSKPEFIDIAWDSAGVTTGPITVPLVILMGLGLGEQMGIVDGFGILASASAFPILTVLFVSKWVERNTKLKSPQNKKHI